MIPRSFLFVPADSEKKLLRARSAGADALILDLEDSVLPENRGRARGLAREFLADRPRSSVWLRINPLDGGDSSADLALASAGPAGLVIPKLEEIAALHALDTRLTAAEQAAGLPHGGIKVMPIATETPRAVLGLSEYRNAPPRLAALTWGAEDLSAALGAVTNRNADGDLAFTYRVVRSLALIAAVAAGVPAIETLYPDFRDMSGLDQVARLARREGFSGMLAIHPDQIPAINGAFTPSAEDVALARRIVAAFAGGQGVVSLDGKMLDRPHLVQAQRVIETAEALERQT
ncbi:MAG: CoA ester lyase [Alphaproteobacteria bacterium]|nr:CoA ester lyase [Alphaproteobacteria bacterium]